MSSVLSHHSDINHPCSLLSFDIKTFHNSQTQYFITQLESRREEGKKRKKKKEKGKKNKVTRVARAAVRAAESRRIIENQKQSTALYLAWIKASLPNDSSCSLQRATPRVQRRSICSVARELREQCPRATL